MRFIQPAGVVALPRMRVSSQRLEKYARIRCAHASHASHARMRLDPQRAENSEAWITPDSLVHLAY